MSVPDAIHQTQKLLNETFNRIQGGSPNELVEKSTKMFNIKSYNKARKNYIAGDRRKPFVVGQRVRVQIKKEKGGELGFKSYKNITFSKRVYIVKKVQASTPPKYWVNRHWYTQDKLKSSEQEDAKSKEMVEKRDKEQEDKDKEKEKKDDDWEKEKAAVMKVVVREEIKEGSRRRTRKHVKSKATKEEEKRMELLDAHLKREEEKVIQRPERKVKTRGKYERANEEEEYLPTPKKKRPQRIKRVKRVKRV